MMSDLDDLAPVVDTDAAWHIFERVARQRRTRRRVGAALATIAVIAVGIAIIEQTNKSGDGTVQVVGQPTVPQSTVPSLPVCVPTQLTATFGFVDNAQEALGGVVLTNHIENACTLSGHPDIQLITATGRYLPIQPTSGNAGNTPPTNSSGPVVLNANARQPQAGVMLAWRNWCASDPGPVVVSLQFATWHANLVASPATNANASTVPPCIHSAESSTITVGSVETHDATGFVAPASAPPAGTCRAKQLALTLSRYVGSVMQQPAAFFALTNTSARTCTLRGYPQLRLYDTSGQSISTTIRDSNAYQFNDPGPHTVSVRPHRRVYFGFGWVRMEPDGSAKGCVYISRVHLLVPGGDEWLTAAASLNDAWFCPQSGGQVSAIAARTAFTITAP
jgi:hypothetical protein